MKKLFLLAFLVLFLLFALGLALAQQAPVTAAERPAQAVEKSVDVGGYHLHFQVITGQGLAILLESGGGMDSTEWNALAPRLAQETGATVIAYDRAEFGQSDLPETPYDLREDTAAFRKSSGWRSERILFLAFSGVFGHIFSGLCVPVAQLDRALDSGRERPVYLNLHKTK